MFVLKALIFLISLAASVAAVSRPQPQQGARALDARHGPRRMDYERAIAVASHSPSGSSTARRAKRTILPMSLPLGEEEDLARCPARMMACPITAGSTDWECVAPKEDLYSCGGCSTLGTGLDCTSLSGVMSVSCDVGACKVHSCQHGHILEGGHCVPTFLLQ